ncbi:pyridoxamine 5'-phosphate oxidase family protein [Micromonospora sp. Llam0]|uniref:pyridoxamine 5'-phosphate oxidase family protein n=1 Tax=Micromonospora sp. Llam0 TaxID=2485143 RepID=UPI0018F2CCE0|nr:pyridoxamine 5'-phosphate oxidase family protein [Micromonospora sp. Llam0]
MGGTGRLHAAIDGRLRDFIEAQPMFFVATAPSDGRGHVNVSPKGMRGAFAVFGEHQVGYLDYHGSGAETVAHVRDNGRITVMFCAFDGPPLVVRLHGVGAVVSVDVHRISDSCGYGVPLMDYRGDRDLLVRANSRRTAEDLAEYRATRNATSIDDLPAFS